VREKHNMGRVVVAHENFKQIITRSSSVTKLVSMEYSEEPRQDISIEPISMNCIE